MRSPAPEAGMDRRHRVVLWALAISRPHALTVDQVAEALWPGTQPATRDKVVQGSISALRKACGKQAIETTTAGYRLAPDVVTTSDDFERHVTRARRLVALGHADRAAALLAETLGSWAGPPYADVSHWPPAVAEQSRLTEVTLQAEELHVQALLGAGRALEALPIARTQATAEPLRETRWLSAATASYRAGNQTAALEALRECRRIFRDELGVDPSDELDRLEVAILRQDPQLSAPPAAAPSPVCPWPGLRAYEQDDAEVFFGREAEVARALEVLDRTGSLAVVGPSGIGKSSFVRAGVASALADAGLRVVLGTPAVGVPPAPADVVIIDQAEELFAITLGEADDLLGRAGQAVVVAIRSDRLSDASALPALAGVLERSLFLLGPITPDGLREAVEQPAAQEGLLVEPGLVELLLRDVGSDAGALPMFSHAMAQTWLRREGRTLTIDGYTAAGGVRGAITKTAEALYDALDPTGRDQLRSLLLRMVSTGDDGETTRTRVSRQHVPVADDLVEHLVSARLVSSDADTLTLTHEALITAWPRLRDWLADDVAGRRQLQHLSQAADAWETMGEPDTELYRGQRLDRAVEWASTTPLQLAETERAFLAASRAAQAAERGREELALQRERRTSRRLRILAAGLGATTLLAVASGAVAVDRQNRSDAAAKHSAAAATEADANRVAAVALDTEDAQLSILLATAAQRLAPGSSTNRALSAALAARPELIATGQTSRQASSIPVTQLATSGARVFALDTRNVITILTPNLAPLGAIDLGDPPTPPSSAALAAGPRWAAATTGRTDEPPITLIDPLTQHRVAVGLEGLPLEGITVASLSLSGDGQALAALLVNGDSRTVMVWSLPSGELLGPRIHAGKSTLVRLSEDGQVAFTNAPLAATLVSDGKLVWDAEQRPAATLDIRGSLVAVPTPDQAGVQLLDSRTGHPKESLTGIDGDILTVTFSPNGASLAGTTSAGITYVWDIPTGQVAHQLHTGAGGSAAFSTTGDALFTGGARPGSVLAWDLQGRRSFLARTARDGFRPITSGTVSLNQDGTWLAMPSIDPGPAQLSVGSVTQGPIRVVRPRDGWRGVGTWQAGAGASRYYYADGKGYLNLLDARSAEPPSTARISTHALVQLASADKDTLLALDEDNNLLVVDGRTLAVRSRTALQERAVSLTASPQRAAVVTQAQQGQGPGLTSWQTLDLSDGRVLARGTAPLQDATLAAMSPDHSHLVLGNDLSALAVIALPTGAVNGGDQPGSYPTGTSVAWSPNSAQVVSSAGLTLKLWDAAPGRAAAQVQLPAAERGAAAAFNADGTITVATMQGNIFRWDPAPHAARAFACRVAGRDLTNTEWREAFGDRTFQTTCQ